MVKDRINFILKNPSEAKAEDISLLENEVEKYPYSQFLHVLLAKVKNQINTIDKGSKLAKAAVYSSDRTALKKVFQVQNYLESNEEIIPYQSIPSFELDRPIYKDSGKLDVEEETASSAIFDEVLKNLEKLKSLRKQFKFLEQEEIEVTNPDEKKQQSTDKEEESNSTQTKKTKEKDKKTASKKKKLDGILEIDEVLDSQVNAFFLNEIEEKKKSSDVDQSEKHHVQSEIIEKFIEDEPTIGTLKKEMESSLNETHKDLSERSTRFGDDLVSENLAVILLKQGKKERAIDIYKKLIWKLPQKKAYFAARIEDIKR